MALKVNRQFKTWSANETQTNLLFHEIAYQKAIQSVAKGHGKGNLGTYLGVSNH